MMSPPRTHSSRRRQRHRSSSRDYWSDKGYPENGFSDRSKEDDLDAKCESLLQGVQSFLREDTVVLGVNRDAFPVFECFATEISSSDAKRKLFSDLRVIVTLYLQGF